MATKKTSIFTLTERMTLTSANVNTYATIDLGSYVDVGDRQAIQVHSVDYVFQATTQGGALAPVLGADSTVTVQVTDLNRGNLTWADDRALVSSGVLTYLATGFMANTTDLFPDNFGKGSDDGRYVVNDALYLTGLATALAPGEEVNVTVRVNASIVSLTAKDFMAIAIQSTAADN